ncbi:hypothetical protein [Salininema proteolyticum]|uniref:PD-(D/E)XK nuclease superfamily protein n=1 Tax=Salininema proteolyticum TaxID=1607685 RepID=A0ABV8TZI3_9ACTN
MPATLVPLTHLGTDPQASGSWPRNGRGQPLVIPRGGGKPVTHTRVTTLASTLDDGSSLTTWKMRTTLWGAATTPSITDRVRTIDAGGPEGKRELTRLAYKAFRSGGGHAKADYGTEMHHWTELHDQGEAPRPSSTDQARDLAAYVAATRSLTMRAIEQPVVVAGIGAAGTADRLLHTDMETPDGAPAGTVVADIKTGSIDGQLTIATQMASYAHGTAYNPVRWLANPTDAAALDRWKGYEFTADQAAEAYTDLTGVNQKWGLVIHLPAREGRCTLHWIDLVAGWEAAGEAVIVRKWRSRKGLITDSISPKMDL